MQQIDKIAITNTTPAENMIQPRKGPDTPNVGRTVPFGGAHGHLDS